MKVTKIIDSKELPKRDGTGTYRITTVELEDGKTASTFDHVEVGDEGMTEDSQYGLKFKKNRGFQRPQRNETQIVRQHSQEMALRTFAILGTLPKTIKDDKIDFVGIQKMIDFWESDAQGKRIKIEEQTILNKKISDSSDEVNLDDIPF